jgi:hypothetical protein
MVEFEKDRQFEGYPAGPTFIELTLEALNGYAQSPSCQFDRLSDLFDLFSETLNPEAVIERYSNGKAVLFCSGWKGHSTKTLLKGNLLVKVNTQKGGGGIRFYRIQSDREAVTPVIKKLMDTYLNGTEATKEKDIEYYNKGIDQELNLHCIGRFKESQKIGSCPSHSAIYALLAGMILLKADGDTLTSDSLFDLIHTTFPHFTRIKHCYLKKAASLIGEVHKHYPEMIHAHAIKDFLKLIFKEDALIVLEELHRLYPDIIHWQDPEKGQSILDLVAKKKSFTKSQRCVKYLLDQRKASKPTAPCNEV